MSLFMAKVRRLIVNQKLAKTLEYQEKLDDDVASRSDLFQCYWQSVEPARVKMKERMEWLSAAIDQKSVEPFLIHFSALGYHMTSQVADWITSAGQACLAQGYMELGQKLVKHAAHEDGHHELYRNDLKGLLAGYNKKHGAGLTADALIDMPPTPGVASYIQLHEGVISSAHPYAQIAIESEIELVSVLYGPMMIGRCVELLGFGILKQLSFVEDHTLLDVGHTTYNFKAMDAFLNEHPETLEPLIDAGRAAIRAYTQYLEDAFDRSQLAGQLSFEPESAQDFTVNTDRAA